MLSALSMQEFAFCHPAIDYRPLLILLSMPTSVFLGLDFGTTGARACVIAKNGEIEEFSRLDFGRLEHSEMAISWHSALLDLLAGLPIGLRKRLSAISIDGTSGTVLPCDEALNPTHVPLLYNDARARSEAEVIAQATDKTHAAAAATSGLAKALWLRQRLTATRSRLFLNQTDWLTGLLSDIPGISDYHNALKMGFEPGESSWPDWVSKLTEPGTLPKVVAPGSPIGLVSRRLARNLNIHQDCLIRAGTTDSIAAFLAAGINLPGEAVTSLGSTLVLKLISTKRVDDARFGIYSHWFGQLWLAGGASNAGGAVLRQHFSDDELTELSERIDPNSDSGLDYYPLPCAGERFPINDPDLLPRLEPRPPDPAQYLHGLLEGLTNVEALGFAKLAELGATRLTRVLSCGGGSGNPVYSRIRERRLQVPVSTAQYQEAAYGSALLARSGTCLFPGVCHD
jgi:sugar (pentulose or hexulose) kinase